MSHGGIPRRWPAAVSAENNQEISTRLALHACAGRCCMAHRTTVAAGPGSAGCECAHRSKRHRRAKTINRARSRSHPRRTPPRTGRLCGHPLLVSAARRGLRVMDRITGWLMVAKHDAGAPATPPWSGGKLAVVGVPRPGSRPGRENPRTREGERRRCWQAMGLSPAAETWPKPLNQKDFCQPYQAGALLEK